MSPARTARAHAIAHGPRRATASPMEPRPCRTVGCGTTVILARRGPNGPYKPYEASDVPPFTQQAIGCHVLVTGTAWKVLDFIEDWMTRHELPEASARELAEGYPWHRPHRCTPETHANADDHDDQEHPHR